MCTSIIHVDVVIPTQTKYLDLVGEIGERIVKKLDHFTGDLEALAFQLNLVLTEATCNAIKHACERNPKDCVRVCIELDQDKLDIKVYDYGKGFDLDKVPVPDLDHPESSECGRGLFFIRALMDSVTYTRKKEENVLEIVKFLN
jgi:serine/threonine-protein kinase RsbW